MARPKIGKYKKIQTSIKIDPEIYKKGKDMAKEDVRSFSQYIEILIRKEIMNKDK